jgi:hypothetical protein
MHDGSGISKPTIKKPEWAGWNIRQNITVDRE